MKPLRPWQCVTVAISRHEQIDFERATVEALDVRPFHQNDPVLFDAKRFSVKDEGLTWARGWDAAARDALEAVVRLQQSA